MRHWLLILLLGLSACNLGQAVPTEEAPDVLVNDDDKLVVAWIDAGNLVVWQTGDSLPRRVASGGVVQPFIAPDGEHIAFTRGAEGRPETLWVIDINGTAEQQLVGERPRNYQPGENQIGDVLWLDETVLYFNTLLQQAPFFAPQNDLYRANIRTREVSLILPAGEGGRIHISPNRERIVTVSHGMYAQEDGVIQVLDPFARDIVDDLLFFVGVSTASEYHFYPEIQWLPDNSAVLVAIPDADLIYSEGDPLEDVPSTELWRLPIANPSQRELLGTVQASFFGLPQWSDDGTAMLYAQRVSDSNQFTAYIADTIGENEAVIFDGEIGTVEAPQWILNSTSYFYAQPADDNTRTYFIGGVGIDPEPLSDERIFDLQFVSSDSYVYVTQGNRRLDMRFGQIGGTSQFIGSLSTVPIYDAVFVQS